MNARHLALHLLLLATGKASNLGVDSPQGQRHLAQDGFGGDDLSTTDDWFGDDMRTHDDAVPTKAPTKKPVVSPSRPPVKTPVKVPTKQPLKLPTSAPKRAASPATPPVMPVAQVPAPVTAPTTSDDFVDDSANTPTSSPRRAPPRATPRPLAPEPAPGTAPTIDDYIFDEDDAVPSDDNIVFNDDRRTDDFVPTRSPIKVLTKPSPKVPTKPSPKAPTPRPVAPVSAPPPTDDYADDSIRAGVSPTRFPTKKPVRKLTKRPTPKPIARVSACRKLQWKCGHSFGRCCVASGLACIYQRKSKDHRCLPCKAAGSRCTQPADCCNGTQCVQEKGRKGRLMKRCQRTRSSA